MAIIGAHVSAAGGAYNCFKRAEKIGAQSIQIFGSSPRQWKTRIPSKEDVKKYHQKQKETKLGPVFLHASYLVNLGSPDNRIFHGSVKNLSDHYRIAQALKAEGLIFHIGSGKRWTIDEAMARVVKGMKKVLKQVPGDSYLIMENAAGGGLKIGDDIEEIGWIYKKINDPRVKVCLDTAHAFEAGVLKNFSQRELNDFVKLCDKQFGWENVVCLHVNDSKTEYNSNHDKHENIGEGYIGLKAFKNLAKNKNFKDLPWILEVPGFDNNGPDKKNIEIVKGLFKKTT